MVQKELAQQKQKTNDLAKRVKSLEGEKIQLEQNQELERANHEMALTKKEAADSDQEKASILELTCQLWSTQFHTCTHQALGVLFKPYAAPTIRTGVGSIKDPFDEQILHSGPLGMTHNSHPVERIESIAKALFSW